MAMLCHPGDTAWAFIVVCQVPGAIAAEEGLQLPGNELTERSSVAGNLVIEKLLVTPEAEE